MSLPLAVRRARVTLGAVLTLAIAIAPRLTAQAPDSLAAQLLEAARDGREQDALRLVASGAGTDARTSDGWSALHFAARDDRRALVALLLAHGATARAADSSGRTPLFLAAFNGNLEVSARLMAALAWDSAAARAQARTAEEQGMLATADSMRRRRLFATAAFLRGAAEGAARALAYAARLPDDALLAAMRDAGVDFDAVDGKGRSAIAAVADSGDVGAMLRLYVHGAQLPRVAPTDVHAARLVAALDTAHVVVQRDSATAAADTSIPQVALEYAVASGSVPLTAALLQHGLSPDERIRVVEGIARRWTPLMLAIDSGRADVARRLIDAGANLYARDAIDNDALRVAAQSRHIELAPLLISRMMDLDGRDVSGRTDLLWAAQRGFDSLGVLLIRAGAATSPDNDGWTPLHHAASTGANRMLDELIARGADAAARTPDGSTPLQLAVRDGHLYAALALAYALSGRTAMFAEAIHAGEARMRALDDSLKLVAGDTRRGLQQEREAVERVRDALRDQASVSSALLVEAAWNGYADRMRALLASHVPADAATRAGPALVVAARAARAEAVNVLLETGASVNGRDRSGWTALHYAARDNAGDIVDSLLAHGADPAAMDSLGRTPLGLAAYNLNVYVADALLTSGERSRDALPNAITMTRTRIAALSDSAQVTTDSAARAAVERRHASALRMLTILEHPERAPGDLLAESTWRGNATRVRALLAQGVSARSVNGVGTPALALALDRGFDTLAIVLLDAGADATFDFGDHWTMLHLAADRGRTAVITSLLQHGADPMLVTTAGRTPLLEAVVQGHADAAALLAHDTRARALSDSLFRRLPEAQRIAIPEAMVAMLEGRSPRWTASRDTAALAYFEAARIGLPVEMFDGVEAIPLAARVLGGLARKLPDPDARDENDWTALAEAAFVPAPDVVAQLLAAHADPNMPASPVGTTAMHLASVAGSCAAARELLRGGADVNAVTASGWSPLISAVESSDKRSMRVSLTEGEAANRRTADAECSREALALLLVGAGADPGHTMTSGESAITTARESGHAALAEVLARGDLVAALDTAIHLGYDERVDALLARGVRPRTSSVLAAVRTDPDRAHRLTMVRRLLAAGADVRQSDPHAPQGTQPLHAAIAADDSTLVAMLLDAGAPRETRDSGGVTPLGIAAARSPASVRLLLSRGADVNVRSSDGDTPLMVAAADADADVVSLLLRHGARVTDARPDGTTALMNAAARGRDSTVAMLLAAGADARARTTDGLTALHLAAQAPDSAAIAMLVRAGADANAVDRAGATPLLFGISNTRQDAPAAQLAVVRALLAAGADPRRADTAGVTPLERAVAIRHPWTVAALVAAGVDAAPLLRLAADSADDVTLAVVACSVPPAAAPSPTALPDSVRDVYASLRATNQCSRAGVARLARARVALDRAWSLLAAGDVQGASRAAATADATYAEALPRRNPARVEAATVHARALMALGRFDAADTVLTAVDSGPDAGWPASLAKIELVLLHGDVHRELGRPGLALLAYRYGRGVGESEALQASARGDASAALDRGVRGMMREAYLDATVGDADVAYQIEQSALERLSSSFSAEIAAWFFTTAGEVFVRQGLPLRAARIFAMAAEASAGDSAQSLTELDGLLSAGRARAIAGDTAGARLASAIVAARARAERGASGPLLAQALEQLGRLTLRDDREVAFALLDRAAQTSSRARTGLVRLQAEAARTDGAGVRGHEYASVAAADALTSRLTREMRLFSSATQRAYVNDVYPGIRDALLVLRDPLAQRAGYSVLSRWKGMLIFLLDNQATDADSRKLNAQLSDARGRLAAWLLRWSQVPRVQWETRYRELTAEKEGLERDLGLTVVARHFPADPLASERLETALGRDGALVDIYRHVPAGAAALYSAVITGGDGTFRVVPLADAATVDSLVSAWRMAVAGGGPGDAEWRQLSQLVWAPVRAALPASAKELWVSPDGALSTVPWQVIARDVGSHVAVVPSPRELLRHRAGSQPSRRESAVVVGAVDFDAHALPDERGSPFPALPGTAIEAGAVAARGRSRGLSVTMLEGKSATKAAVLDAMTRAAWVHIATHGFFAASGGGASDGTRGVSDDFVEDAVATSRNPLLESGLAFAGANVSASRSRGSGILTAEELVGVDLTHTRLVVLSACETALGSQVAGQGVQGLQSALLAAGAQGMLMSLWKVPDASTALLMTRFYEGMWKRGLPPADALRLAQDAVRADPRYRAPIHWAGWVLVGRVW